MQFPYYAGAEYQLNFRPPHAHEDIRLSVKVLEVFEPITISPVLKVALATSIPNTLSLPSIMMLKLYDRRYSTSLRKFFHANDFNLEWEKEYQDYMADEDSYRPTADDWDDLDCPEKVEAFIAAHHALYYENEVTTYKKMESLQGKEIPFFLGTTHFVDSKDHPDMIDTEVPGILLEYVQGTPLDKLPPTSAIISPAFCQKCLDIVQEFGDANILNKDVRLGNFIVPEDRSRPVVMIDFAQVRMRDEDEDDMKWREAKWSTDEEGAIGTALERVYGWDYKRSWRYVVYSDGSE